MSDAGKAVFLSYASQDAAAAKRIAEALRAAGVEVWFDQNELVGGDAWDAKIRGQIGSCALFVPIISANTQARLEGYFRREWKQAASRTHDMADEKTFLLPVVIDDTKDAVAKVPAEFKAVQWTRLPGGETPASFVARVQRLLQGAEGEAERPRSASRGEGAAAPSGKSAPAKPTNWKSLAFAAVGIGIGLFYAARPWWQTVRPPTEKPAAPAAPAAASLTEAQKLVAQAEKIYAGGDELDRETMFLADELVKRALVLDPAEPSAWTLAARLSYIMVWQGFDNSEARKADLQRQSARARALAPESVPAQLAVINAQLATAFANFQSASNRQDLTGMERDLLALAARAPQDHRVQQALGQTYRFLKRPDEALQAMRRSLELSGGESSIVADVVNVLLRRKRYAEAEAMIAPALARQPVGRILALDVMFKTVWRGDLAAAQAAVAGWPGWLLREDRGAFIAWQAWMFGGRPDMALDVAARLPRDYLRDVWFTGPRAVLTARAHELAGHEEAAETDWRTVLRIVDRELAASPDDEAALFWKTWAQSRLGDRAGAEASSTLLKQRNLKSSFFRATSLALLWSTMGRTDLAAEHLRAGEGEVDDAYAVTRKMLELDPAYEALRKDPQFAALAAAALAPASPVASAKADDKSVAVLAFANLSDDKANEYFSDGISEELLNVLAKVPGLKVSARTSAFYFKGKDVPIPEIAQKLGVAYVVEGSVRKAGDKVRITAQLIKAADGFHLWSDTFTRDVKDVFAVQDEIAGLIAKNLSLKMGMTSASEALDAEVLPLYYAALQAWNLRTLEGMDRAEELLNRALGLAPNFARGHAALAKVWAIRGELTDTLSPFGVRDGPVARTIRQKVDQALALDPQCAEAYGALGVYNWDTWKTDEAAVALRRATQLNPNYASAHQWLGRVRSSQGYLDEGLASLQRAVEVDPLSQRILDNCGRLLYLAERPREALAMAERALVIQPGATQVQALKAQALLALGQADEALRIARTLPGNLAIVSAQKVQVLAATGHLDEVEQMLPQLTGANLLAKVGALVALGRTDAALAALDPNWFSANRADLLLFEHLLDPIRHEPAFDRLLGQLGLREAHQRAQAWRAAHPPEKPTAKK